MYLRGEVEVGGLIVYLSRQQVEVLSTIMMRPLTSKAQIIEAVWPDPDLEPDSADNMVSGIISKLRRKGVPIGNRHGLGFEIDPNYFASGA